MKQEFFSAYQLYPLLAAARELLPPNQSAIYEVDVSDISVTQINSNNLCQYGYVLHDMNATLNTSLPANLRHVQKNY